MTNGGTAERRGADRPFSKPSDEDNALAHGEQEAESLHEQQAWIKTVQQRIDYVRRSLQRNQKRGAVFAGLALVLAAVGLGLIVNRVLDRSAASFLTPATAINLFLGGGIGIWAAELLFRLIIFRDKPAGEHWKWLNVVAVASIAFGVVLELSGSHGLEMNEGKFRFGHGALGTAFAAAALGMVMIALYFNGKQNRDEQDIADLQFEHDLLRHAVKPFQTRAEKLLSVNQIQLRRYYELNLQQARAVFMVGVGCIAAGALVVGATFWVVYWLGEQPTKPGGVDKTYTQMVVALVGGVGTLLTNYVAALYFKLHGSISDSLMAFHHQLASTHDLFFANVLASSVQDKKERSDALIKLATAIASRKIEASTRKARPKAKIA